jgi:hypothetical protein
MKQRISTLNNSKVKERKKEEKPDLAEDQKLSEVRSRSISSLPLPELSEFFAKRVRDSLEKNGIRTLGALEQLSKEDLKKIKYVKGEKTTRVIESNLIPLGLALSTEWEKMQRKLHMPVSDLEVSVRISNVLKYNNIKYLYQLVQYTDGMMVRMKNFGRKSLRELKQILAIYNLSLGMKFSELDLVRAKRVWKLASYSEIVDAVREYGCKTEKELMQVNEPLCEEVKKRDLFKATDLIKTEKDDKRKSSEQLFEAVDKPGIIKKVIVLDNDVNLEDMERVIRYAEAELEKLQGIVNPNLIENLEKLFRLIRLQR